MAKKTIKKKPVGNAMIQELQKKQDELINAGKDVENKIVKPDQAFKTLGEKKDDEIKEDKKEFVKVDKTKKDKKREEEEVIHEDVSTIKLEFEYEQFFKASEKYETEKLESVYVFTPIHRKLKNLVVAENRRGLNMTVLLSNIVDDFFSTHESEIKKSLKKLTQI